MKIFLRLLILLFLVLGNTKMNYCQWVETKGPMGCYINSFYISGNRVFVLTDDSIYVSTNNGKSWIGINNGYNSNTYEPRSFAAIDSNLFIITYGGAIFHSSNTGLSWNKYNASISNSAIWDFAVCESSIFAGTYGAGVFISTGNGITWNPVNNSLNDLHIQLLKSKGKYLFAWNNDRDFLHYQ